LTQAPSRILTALPERAGSITCFAMKVPALSLLSSEALQELLRPFRVRFGKKSFR
jgi:hypothetical protein